MGKIADALRSNLQELAQSDARSLRAIDQELKAAREPQPPAELKASMDAKALLVSGSFELLKGPSFVASFVLGRLEMSLGLQM